MNKYETVVGLEVHVQLDTETKAFCSCKTTFGQEPNTQVCPVCLGHPGVLPVLNRKFIEYGIKVALALDCDVQKVMKFDRKNYYYPDLPKNYQISQFDMPLAFKGEVGIVLDCGEEKIIGITRVHMEEDAGKLIHAEDGPYSCVDLNRTGTCLLEIVSEPDMRSPEEAYEYLVNLKQIIEYLGVSDCNMEEGSLRCDANISLREKGASELGSKVEIKNMNSFKAVREGLLYEEERQADLLDEGTRIPQETRLWDENKNITLSMRSKEESQDYRYFPEPDLVPYDIPVDIVEDIRKNLPELPKDKEKRFIDEYALSVTDTGVLTAEKDIADFFEKVNNLVKDPQNACNWVKGEIMMHLRERQVDIKSLGIDPVNLVEIIKMTKNATLSHLVAKEVLRESIDTGKDPLTIVKEKGLEQVSDKDELQGIIEKVVSENEKSANDFKGGKENALSFLIGQVMKNSKGKANPKIAGDMLRKVIRGE